LKKEERSSPKQKKFGRIKNKPKVLGAGVKKQGRKAPYRKKKKKRFFFLKGAGGGNRKGSVHH